MVHYIFILGRNPALSLLELVSYCKKEGITSEMQRNNELVFASLPSFSHKKAIKQLGGTIKIGKKLEKSEELYNGTKNKITFAVNLYKADPSQVIPLLKKKFKELGVQVMQKHAKTKEIAPKKTKNLDVELIAYRNTVYKVVAATNPKEYKERDEARPVFNPLKVTSIRLAKMLINLAQPKQEVCDPFCGNGTILQEALLMGYKCIGLDLQTKDAHKNLRWLQAKQPAVKKKWTLLQGDATRLSKRIKTVECVVTEPYLGPYHKKPPAYAEAKYTAKHLEELYTKALKEFHTIVQGKIVIIFPKLLTKERKSVSLPINKILQESGFKPYTPSKEIPIPLAYAEKRNNLQRFIYILEKA